MNIQYLNHPPYPNRWMITLIQQGSVCDLERSEPGFQEDVYIIPLIFHSDLISDFLNLCFYRYIFMRYIIHLYLVLGNCTQVHLQCTWVAPKYISQNPVLVLEHF